MSADKHRNDQASRALRGPRRPPGEEQGLHMATTLKGTFCKCGGCKGDGTRYGTGRAQVKQL